MYHVSVLSVVTAPQNWSKGKLLGSGAFGQVRMYCMYIRINTILHWY